ncbi:SDR family NAD(P)-dependent oxidoreductase, partial [Thioclava sp. BHET1]
MQRVLLSVGHGYSARHFARQLIAEGWQIIGTTRSVEKAESLRQEGVEPLIWPDADLAPALARATHLLTSVAPDGEGDPLLRLAGPQIAAAQHLQWIGYLSTTGVYGDHRGGWVDEDAPLAPSTRRGRARVAAEAAWRALCTQAGLPLHIFRLAGIYG